MLKKDIKVIISNADSSQKTVYLEELHDQQISPDIQNVINVAKQRFAKIGEEIDEIQVSEKYYI